MAIELLTVCEWNGPQMVSTDILAPKWSQVEAAIRALDECVRNDLYLQPRACDPETYLAVGGGNGRYVATGSINNERFPTAVWQLADNGSRESLVVGGQTGDYPRSWILDLDSALRATRSFFDTGEFSGGGVTWLEV